MREICSTADRLRRAALAGTLALATSAVGADLPEHPAIEVIYSTGYTLTLEGTAGGGTADGAGGLADALLPWVPFACVLLLMLFVGLAIGAAFFLLVLYRRRRRPPEAAPNRRPAVQAAATGDPEADRPSAGPA